MIARTNVKIPFLEIKSFWTVGLRLGRFVKSNGTEKTGVKFSSSFKQVESFSFISQRTQILLSLSFLRVTYTVH